MSHESQPSPKPSGGESRKPESPVPEPDRVSNVREWLDKVNNIKPSEGKSGEWERRLMEIEPALRRYVELLEVLQKVPIGKDAAASQLKFLDSEHWQDVLKDPSFLQVKVAYLYEEFFNSLRSWREGSEKQKAVFEKFYEPVKQIVTKAGLEMFQEEPGPIERDVSWYEADPPATIFQSSEFTRIIRPGLFSPKSGVRQLKCIVEVKRYKE